MNKNKDPAAQSSEASDPYVFQPPGSLLLLQTLLYFDWWYTMFVFVLSGLTYLFKLYALPYPQGYFSIEILILLIYLGLSS